SWEKAVRGRSVELSGRVPLRAGDVRPGVRRGCRSARTRVNAATAVGTASATERSGHGGTTRLAGAAVCGTQDRTKLWAGQSHHLSPTALAAADFVSARSRNATGQQHCREGVKAGGTAS